MRLLTNTFENCSVCAHTGTHKRSYTCSRGHTQRAKTSDGNITMGVSVPKLTNSTELRQTKYVEINCFQHYLVSDLKYSVL